VVLTDTLPMSTQLVSAIPSQGDDCQVERKNATTDAVLCRLGQLSGGKIATVTIVLAADEALTPASAKSIVHSVQVVAEQVDPDPGNNELIESIPVSIETKE
jgi:hypothetical protein